MKIRVYVQQNGDGRLEASCDAADVQFVDDVTSQMTEAAKDQASEFLYLVECAAVNRAHNDTSIILPTVILVELSATAFSIEV